MLAPSVEASRAKRLERQQSRFRDRGGVFVPSERNVLLEILLEKAPTHESAVKTRRKDEGATDNQDLGKDKEKAKVGALKKPRQSQAQARRKSKAALELERARNGDAQAGPSDLSKAPKEVKKARASRAGTAKAPVLIDDEDGAPAPPATKKPTKKAQPKDKCTASQDPPGASDPAPKKAPARKRPRKVAEEDEGESDFEQTQKKRTKTVKEPAKRGRPKKPAKDVEINEGEIVDKQEARPVANARGRPKGKGKVTKATMRDNDPHADAEDVARPRARKAPAKKLDKESVPLPGEAEDEPLQEPAPVQTNLSGKSARAQKSQSRHPPRDAVAQVADISIAVTGEIEEPVKRKPARKKLQVPESDDEDEDSRSAATAKSMREKVKETTQADSADSGNLDVGKSRTQALKHKPGAVRTITNTNALSGLEEHITPPPSKKRPRETQKADEAGPDDVQPDPPADPPPKRTRTTKKGAADKLQQKDNNTDTSSETISLDEAPTKAVAKGVKPAKRAASTRTRSRGCVSDDVVDFTVPTKTASGDGKASVKKGSAPRYKPKPKPRLSMFPAPRMGGEDEDDPLDCLS
ncbi:hypothetical protein CERSUDRAFT_116620 [Gelatoporia subvermispora B]|uniref:Uncharacterized protein n=1 Tax=Ceriporiopsis subvermispora (strain B) TaxID=914234 RepID=M2QSX7_CERS8|nr:hypothetical protein CERSUDRAFT_116620 [Gelatoporia subvermispora B]